MARDADQGDAALVLVDSGSYGTEIVRIEEIDSPGAEYHLPRRAMTPTLRLITRPLRENHPGDLSTPVLGRSEALKVEAIDMGRWGNRLRILTYEESSPCLRGTKPILPQTPGSSPTLTLRTTVGIEAGTILEFSDSDDRLIFRQKVTGVLPGNVVSFGPRGLIHEVTDDMIVRSVEFAMTVELTRINPRTKKEEPVEEEIF